MLATTIKPISLKRPLVSVWTVLSVTDLKTEDEVLAAIGDGRLLWAFNIAGKKAKRALVRVLAVSVYKFVEGRQPPTISEDEQWKQVQRMIFPTPGLAAYQGAQQDIKNNQGLLDSENKKDEALHTTAEIAKSDLDETKRVQSELKKSIDDLTIKVGELAATNKANETNAATVAGLNKQAEKIKAGVAPPISTDVQPPPAASTQPPFLPAGTSAAPGRVPFEQTDEGKARFDFGLAQQYSDHIASGGKLDNGQQQIFQTIANAMLGHASNQKELADLVDQLHSALVTDREAINKKFNNLITDIARAQKSADLH
jgi:hypothetical protein